MSPASYRAAPPRVDELNITSTRWTSANPIYAALNTGRGEPPGPRDTTRREAPTGTARPPPGLQGRLAGGRGPGPTACRDATPQRSRRRPHRGPGPVRRSSGAQPPGSQGRPGGVQGPRINLVGHSPARSRGTARRGPGAQPAGGQGARPAVRRSPAGVQGRSPGRGSGGAPGWVGAGGGGGEDNPRPAPTHRHKITQTTPAATHPNRAARGPPRAPSAAARSAHRCPSANSPRRAYTSASRAPPAHAPHPPPGSTTTRPPAHSPPEPTTAPD